jgi:hydrogenase expression/formation protein HypE
LKDYAIETEKSVGAAFKPRFMMMQENVMTTELLPAGKLRPETLAKLLRHTSQAPEVVVGPAVGEDAAVIKQGNQYLVVATDPITFATERCGWYSVFVNANDIAACGGTPRYYSAAIVLPEGKTSLADVETLFAEIENACREIGVLWVGGHTEVSSAVNTVLVAGQMIGDVTPDHLCRSSDAQVGDFIVLVKAAAIEATAIIAIEKADEVAALHGEAILKKSQNFLLEPGISVVQEAALARNFPVNAMHDPTEGGVTTGIREICMASNCGALVKAKAIPILPETAALCHQFGLDPLGAISSGALLLTLPAEAAPGLMDEYSRKGIQAAVIGEIAPLGAGLQIEKPDGKVAPLPEFVADEITKLYT